ncbi:ABC-three component system middle component 1 [Novacetimonas hansenii]|uniref:ABC-three component system middle component 1 n=1 Tax=Novacetimonas hansenii TaxID=436 RepID=UPI00094F4DC4|nr:ABC-three component system middle component 1 [Novacetimonas hansenii]PYD71784.1 hypothetical protein CFR74_13050 [Novacetimonas hansenii]
MRQDAESPGTQVLGWVARQLKLNAEGAGLQVQDMPRLVGDSFDDGIGLPGANIGARDLPMVRQGLVLGRHAIVLGLLPEVLGTREIADTMRQYRNQCVVARSMLSPNAVLDLLLVMVGPRGSEGKDAWRALALSVERDDRVARKLVWLRPTESRADEESFAAFVKRSFLARPWVTREEFSAGSLDDISSAVEIEEPPRDTSGQWNRLALLWGDDPDLLVEKLIDVWKERSAT